MYLTINNHIMNFNIKLIITSLILVASFNLQTVSAQSIDVNNRVEFSQGEVEDDFNSISVTDESKSERTITKKVVEDIDNTSLTDLAKILENKNLRYRNVRKPAEKCYRDTEESCANH